MIEAIKKVFVTDVTVIGSGLAGLSTIYFLDRVAGNRVKVAIVSKSPLGYGTSTYYSAGVFRCPTNGYSVKDYVRDTITAGRYINKRALVELMALRAAACVKSLEELGLRFESGRGRLKVVSSDSLFAGKELVLALRSYILSRPSTVLLESTHMLDIVKNSNGSFSTACITSDGSYVIVNSKVVVLATGGAANVYIRSDNPTQLTCDGHGVCLRLGLPLIDMEFIQFFPLGIAEPGKYSFMIPFTKGRLVNRFGEDIIVKYGLESLGKAIVFNRDKLSRYIMLEVLKGGDIDGALHLYPEQPQFEEDIDALTLYASELRKRLNLKTPIRVLPTAHFSMGGVETESNLKTVIDGLYVVGELVGGIHGANRLGGNALTACVVTAEKVAENILTYTSSRFREGVEEHIEEEVKHALEKYRLRNGEYTPSEVRTEIRNIMWLKAGVIRNEESLKQGFEELLSIHENLGKVRISNHEEVIKYSEMLNTLLTALAVTYSALLRKESRGAHFRLDYPEESSNWVKNIRITYEDGKFRYEIL